MKHIVEVEEISISVPWGYIAAKWWGPLHIRPIVMLHGWQDNAGTFDPIIPLLPGHISYLAVDLPGHGLSTHLPNGMIYSHFFYLYVLRLIHKKFDWQQISLIGHSMGSIICFMYASSFPNECDMVVALDALKPNELNIDLVIDFYRNGFTKIYIADEWNDAGKEPPIYTYEEIIYKLMNGIFSSYTEESLPYLLVRGIKESESNPGKYLFTRDNRLKTMNVFVVESDVNVDLAVRITAPYCFIKALQYRDASEWVYLDEILHKMKNSNPKFEVHGVDGSHHVHLTEPEKVSHIISQFISKYRLENSFSKL